MVTSEVSPNRVVKDGTYQTGIHRRPVRFHLFLFEFLSGRLFGSCEQLGPDKFSGRTDWPWQRPHKAPLRIHRRKLRRLRWWGQTRGTVVSYQFESFSSKWELPSLLSRSFITRGRMEARKTALILMTNSHFDRTLQYHIALIFVSWLAFRISW